MWYQYYQTNYNHKWKVFPLIIPVWNKDINIESRIWNKKICSCPRNSKCSSPEACGESRKIQDHSFFRLLIQNRKKSIWGLALFSLSFLTLTGVAINFTLIGISNLSFNSTINYYDGSSSVDDQVVEFTVAVIDQSHKWAFGSRDSLESGLTVDIFPRLFRHMRQDGKLSDWIGIVAVGMASEEGTTLEEERRANLRASEIMRQLYPYTPQRDTRLFLLNLGQFTEDTNLEKEETGIQRLAVIIGIHSMPPNLSDADLTSALKAGLKNLPKLDVQIDQYSLFELVPSHLNPAI